MGAFEEYILLLNGVFIVFARCAGAVALLPGIGEVTVPARIKLVFAVALTALVWPLVATSIAPNPGDLPYLIISEAVVGLVFGSSLRFMVLALQFAGTVAGQATSLAQVSSGAMSPDPIPALGSVLVLTAVTLAMILGLQLHVIEALAASYTVLAPGHVPSGAEVAEWAVAHGTRVFALGLTLAAPFVLAAFVYNLALGAINRAMPQLMVVLVGAPAITLGTLALLLLSAPLIAGVWAELALATLRAPMGAHP